MEKIWYAGMEKSPEGQKVSILGTEYTVFERTENEDVRLEHCDGYCDTSTKEIVIRLIEGDLMSKRNLGQYRNVVIRHEVIHAFLAESGLDGNGHKAGHWEANEEMVDWFAIQFPKIVRVFKDLEVL